MSLLNIFTRFVSKPAVLILPALTAAFLSAACDSKAGEKDRETEQALFLYLMRPVDVNGICEENTLLAFDCADASGLPAAKPIYLQFKASLYKVTLPMNTDTKAYCSTVLNSPDFPVPVPANTAPEDIKTYSDGAKICAIRCEGDYWKRMKSESRCTAENYQNLPAALVEDDTHQECLKDCLDTGSVIF